MAITAKGSRRIEVDGIAYRWKIARHTRGGLPFIDVLVSQEGTLGATLMQPHQTWPSPYLDPMLSPAHARSAILQGLAQGWQPSVSGPQMVLPTQDLFYDDLPTVSPQKSLGHALLHIVCEHRRLAFDGFNVGNPHLHFSAGAPPQFHLDWMLNSWPDGELVQTMVAATQAGQEAWANLQEDFWQSSDRTQLFRAWANTLPRLPNVVMPHAQFLELHPIAKKAWAQAMNQRSGQRHGNPAHEKAIWGWADLLWDRFPEIWQVKAVDGTAIQPALDPYSICVIEPTASFIGVLSYPIF